MAIVVTALGTAQNKASADPWTPFSNITLASGDALFLCLTSDYPTSLTSIKWNNIVADAEVYKINVNGVVARLTYWLNVTGATGNVVVDYGVSVPVAMAATLYKASGIATSSALDKSSTGANTGTAAYIDTTGVLSQADELAIAVSGVEDEIDDAHGAWTSGAGWISGNEQFDATNGGGDASNVQCHSVAMVVASTNALDAYDGLHDNSNWAIVVATFKGAGGGPSGWTQIAYTSEPPTPNAWNQIKQTGTSGFVKLEYS